MKMQDKAPDITRKISRLYLLALTAVALLSAGGQLLVQHSLKNQLSDSRVINIAGRQRMLSQKICKLLLLLPAPGPEQETTPRLAELQGALALWVQCHEGLQRGYLPHIRTPVQNSREIRRMFDRLDPLFRRMHARALAVSRAYRQGRPLVGVKENVSAFLAQERVFLQAMDRIVFQYDAEAVVRVEASRRIEYLLWLATLLVLLLEGLFIFRPAVNQLHQTISLLLDSRRQVQEANEELLGVNQSLESARLALVEAERQKHRQEMKEQKLRSAYLVEGQEEERKRVAREIHDGLGQMLTALKYGIEKIADALPATAAEGRNLAELRQVLSQTMAEARNISFNLMPAVLSDFGLPSALKMLVSQVASASGARIVFDAAWNGQRLSRSLEIGLYRVSQEAIHNAVKYAGAREIRLALHDKKKFIYLEIADNGRGFDYGKRRAAARQSDRAQGISNMEERVFLLNGRIDIITRPGQGTRILVKVPARAQIQSYKQADHE